jgi:hypothetical protein
MRTYRKMAAMALVLAAGAAMAQPIVPPEDIDVIPPKAEVKETDRAPRKLFAAAEAPEGGTPHRQAVEWHPVAPNMGVVRSSMVGDRIVLNVSPELDLTMLVTKVENHGEAISVWGRLVGFEDSSVILVAQDDALASDITAPPAGLHYKTKYAVEGGGGVHFICRMDDDRYAPCGGRLAAPAGDALGG